MTAFLIRYAEVSTASNPVNKRLSFKNDTIVGQLATIMVWINI